MSAQVFCNGVVPVILRRSHSTRLIAAFAKDGGRLRRVLDGVERMIAMGPSDGKSAGTGRVARMLLPAGEKAKTGPGPWAFISAAKLVQADGFRIERQKTIAETFRRMVAALEKAGYFTSGSKAAAAGDTIEFGEIVSGKSRLAREGAGAGVYVRASERGIEADRKMRAGEFVETNAWYVFHGDPD